MDELRLGDGPLEVVLLPQAGARLHRLQAFGHDLLRTPTDPAEHLRVPFFWGAYVMAPWCNRFPAGPTTVGAQRLDLPANFADGTAIHGQVYASEWTVEPDGVALHRSGGGDSWPWQYEVTLIPVVSGPLLRLELAVRNDSSEPMPAGVGLHPWWRRPLELSVDAPAVYPSNDGSPAVPSAVQGPLDLRDMAEPAPGLDATWAQLGRGGVRLSWPHLGVHAVLRLSSASSHVVVATPAELDATAVEVQSHAPDGLRRLRNGEPGAPAVLQPGERLRLELELEVMRA